MGVTAVPFASGEASGPPVFEGPVATAACGPGSSPETGLQGEVPAADRASGRSSKGYWCNLSLIGQYTGQGAGYVSPSFRDCSYQSQATSSLTGPQPGVLVVDARDRRKPVLATRLTSPGMLYGTWESLKVNEPRALLAGVAGGNSLGPVFFDVYDVGADCRAPRLLNSLAETDLSLPANTLGHEGNWAPDGKTYWSASAQTGRVTAIDVSDPSLPRVVYTNTVGFDFHGLSLSADGRRLYLAKIGNVPISGGNGLQILDVSQVQERRPLPQISTLGRVTWTDGGIGQHAEHFTKNGRPYVLFVDETGAGAARIIDVQDERAPRVVAKLKLQIHMPAAAKARDQSAGGTIFGYDGHYCALDRAVDPTAAACGYFESGVRVFDIRALTQPKEIAYFNPKARPDATSAELSGSEHVNGFPPNSDRTADFCSSPPRFVVPDQLWVTCQDNGFMVLRFTNDAYPLPALSVAAPAAGRAAAEAPRPVVAKPRGDGSGLPATGSTIAPALLGMLLITVGAMHQHSRRTGCATDPRATRRTRRDMPS